MEGLLFLFGLFLALGLFFLTASVLKLPTMGAAKAIGLNGEEFATARQHLLANLPGCIAWKDPAQAEAQKERMRQKREKELAERIQRQEIIHPIEELESAGEAQESPAFCMRM